MIREITGAGRIDGHPLRQAVLEQGEVRVTILSLGCITRDWRVGGRSVVLGFADPLRYLENPFSFGVIAGRVANRTAHGRFRLDGRTVQLSRNHGAHHLHGGVRGLGRRNWLMEADGPHGVRLSRRSPAGEEGYPGAVDFSVTIRLEDHRLHYDMRGQPDCRTPVNLAQHSYYNLAGGGSVRDHELRIAASRFTPTDDAQLPTGEIRAVAGTRHDFTAPRTLAQADPAARGHDVNLVLDPDRERDAPAAILRAPDRALVLRLWTDQPGIQLYDAMHMGACCGGHDGKRHDRFHGLCLEPQHFPDALNRPGFPSILCTPEAPYRQRLTVEIGSEGP